MHRHVGVEDLRRGRDIPVHGQGPAWSAPPAARAVPRQSAAARWAAAWRSAPSPSRDSRAASLASKSLLNCSISCLIACAAAAYRSGCIGRPQPQSSEAEYGHLKT